jgi:hypothetical protein
MSCNFVVGSITSIPNIMVIQRKATCPADLKTHLAESAQKAELPPGKDQRIARPGVEGLSEGSPSKTAGSLPPRKAFASPKLDAPTLAPATPHLYEMLASSWDELGAKLAEMGSALVIKRNALQGSSEALLTATPAQRADKELVAHQDLRQYAQQDLDVPAVVMATLHKVGLVGLAGAGMTFGVSRSLGMAAAVAAQQKAAGLPIAWGLLAKSAVAAKPTAGLPQTLAKAAVTAGLQWSIGALVGGAGNLAGQRFVAPPINLLPARFTSVPLGAVVPQEMRDLLNKPDKNLLPGQRRAGDRLCQQVEAAQADIGRIDSDRNIALGQACFVIATAMRTLAQGAQVTGVAGTVALGAAVSLGAGSALAVGQSLHSNQADAAGLPLSEVPHHEVPVFMTQHVAPQPAVARAALAPQNLEQRAVQFAANLTDFSARAAHRGLHLAKATAPATALGVMASGLVPMVVKALPVNPEASGLGMRTTVACLGAHNAVKHWFPALMQDIPKLDAELQARQEPKAQPE